MNFPTSGMVKKRYRRSKMVTAFDVRDIQTQADFDSKKPNFGGRTLSPLAKQLMRKRNIQV